MSAASRIKGWCPGALAPMESGDGLLLRVRTPAGQLTPAMAGSIAALARRHGNGQIDLSRRGNLQLRGLRTEELPAVHRCLADLGLLDERPEKEAIRNVIAPPLGGIDPTAAIDGAALALALEAGLTGSDDLVALPGKFGFSVDDGGRIGLGDLPVDIRLTGQPSGVIVAPAGPLDAAALVERDAAVPAALALARAFLTLSARLQPAPRRMRDLVAAVGAAAVLEAAGLTRTIPADRLPVRRMAPLELLGLNSGCAGVAAPFGRLDAGQLAALAAAAPDGLRLTPWRLLLLPAATAADLDRLAAIGLITDPGDPRLGAVACPGAPFCAAAEAETRAAAERIAALRRGGSPDAPWLHVSGCGKGCAHGGAAAVTLVGRAGRYDLVPDGRADGKVLRQGLTLSDVEDMIRMGRVTP